MTPPDATAVEHHLRRLDGEALRSFVADLWSARGFETTRAGEAIVATDGAASLVVYPIERRYISVPRPTRPVDVVVAPGGGARATAVAAAHDARLLDARDLAEMLWYALDRASAADLCERHLGAPPEALRPPLRRRLREVREVIQLPPVAPTAVLLAAVVLLSVGTIAGLALTGSGVTDTPVTNSSTTGGASADETDEATTPSTDLIAPGLSDDGITNVTALSAAHDRALGEQSYTLWLDIDQPREQNVDAPRVTRDIDITVEGDRYLTKTTVESEGVETPTSTIYHDGTDWYIFDQSYGIPSYNRLEATGSDSPVTLDPSDLRRTMVTRFLSTPETEVVGEVRLDEQMESDNRAIYRVVGRGRPSELTFSGPRNYTVTALIDERGFVHHAAGQYTIGPETRPYTVQFSWTYGNLGTTTVNPPTWYERRFAGNGTGSGVGFGDDGTEGTGL